MVYRCIAIVVNSSIVIYSSTMRGIFKFISLIIITFFAIMFLIISLN